MSPRRRLSLSAVTELTYYIEMLKKFFTIFLGSMAAIWLSILLLVGIFTIGIIVWLSSAGVPEIEDGTYLYIRLDGNIADRSVPPSITDVVINGESLAPSLEDITAALGKATTDSRIAGVYIDCEGSALDLASREEMREALIKFKKSGKTVVAYGDTFAQGDYYTASVADYVYLNPTGTVDVAGLAAQVPFFKNALDKLGVEIQVIKVGTFKSAVEPYILTSMSDPARLQYDQMLETMWDVYTRDVADNLGMPDSASMINRMASVPMLAYTPSELVKAKIVSDVKYRYQVEQKLREDANTGDELRLVSPRTYLASGKDILDIQEYAEKSHIALIYAVGDIVDRGDNVGNSIVGERMSQMVIKLADDNNVKGLVLRVNSGGGSAFASEQIWASLEYFKSKNKPFVVSMGGAAASGGYYISCGADKIYADATTITGSIGIFGIIPYARELLNDKLGISFDVVQTNPNAAFPRIDAPLTTGQRAALEKAIHAGYDLFVKRVADGRGLSTDSVRSIAEGRVWVGATAKKIGLVDELGGLSTAITYTAGKAGVSSSDYVSYPVFTPSPWDAIMTAENENSDPRYANVQSETIESLRTLGLTADEVNHCTSMLKRILSMGTMQAKMEDIKVW